MTFESINPATGERIAAYDRSLPVQVEEALASAHRAFVAWHRAEMEERAAALRSAARYLRRHRDRFALLITAEMGKPIAEAEAEIEKCAWCCDHFAAHGPGYLADEPVSSNASESSVVFEPLGVVLAVMPWNFPFWQFFRFAAPALMAGNTALLKHAPNVSGCAFAIEEVIREAGFPTGTVRTILVETDGIAAIVDDDRVAAVTLTGSVGAGRAIGALAGRALKKAVLELGGSDAFIVLDDADLEGAVATAVRSRYQNGGQSCIAAKRFIVTEGVASEFEACFVDAVTALRVGASTSRETQVGPLARADLRDNLERQVQGSVAMGARVATGGYALEGPGFYYAPTVLTGVTPEMPAFHEETFGPLAVVVRVRDADEAVTLANDSVYGLGGAIWTASVERGKRLARQIAAGAVFVNGMTASDPRLPFGGVKHSGYGRELGSFGAREFTNTKTVWVGPAREEAPADVTGSAE